MIILSFPAFSEMKNDPSTLIVSGTGSVMVKPDHASVQLGVEVSRKTAQEAQAENARLMGNIISAVRKLGIAEEKIQTSGFNIWPETKYEKDQPSRIVAYHCRNNVNITIEDLKAISRVIDAGTGAGANNINGLVLSRKNDAEAKKQALEKAVSEAESKAKAIAAAAKVKLKGITNIIETGSIAQLPIENLREVKMMGTSGAAETPISAGLIEIKAAVTITYRIE